MQVALWLALQLLVKRYNNGMAAVEDQQGQGNLVYSLKTSIDFNSGATACVTNTGHGINFTFIQNSPSGMASLNKRCKRTKAVRFYIIYFYLVMSLALFSTFACYNK